MAHTGTHSLGGNRSFDLAQFLTVAGAGRRIVHCDPKGYLFSQGDSADSVFYLQSGRVKVTVAAANGKEATVTLLTVGDFAGEDSLADEVRCRSTTVTAITPSNAMKIDRNEMLRVMRDEYALYDLFMSHLLARSIRTQADLVDQLFNSSEKRLARILLLMAGFEDSRDPARFIPPITQETLAEMIGTTRSRVSFFMNRFRKLGFIEYDSRIKVHGRLLEAVLLDGIPEHGTQSLRIPPQSDIPQNRSIAKIPA